MDEPVLDHAGLEILSMEECRVLLQTTPIGRIAFVDRGEATILPITIGMWDRAIVFTTAPGSKLEAAIMNRPVSVEIDGWDAERHNGWSVLVKGTAMTVDDGREIDSLDRLSVTSWVRPEVPKAWVRVLPNEITGRRIPDRGVSPTCRMDPDDQGHERPMSTDETVTKDLVQTLEDGKEGYESAAAKLADSDSPELAQTFRQFSEQRAAFAEELRQMAASYGDDADESGSIAGAVHRGWMSIKDALSGSDPDSVIAAAEQGEDHAVSEYQKALDADISQGLRAVVQRQFEAVRAAHDTVRQLRATPDAG